MASFDRRRRGLPGWAVFALLATIVLGVYGRSAGFGYVFDDECYVLGPPEMREGVSLRTVHWAVTSRDYGNWFPLTRLSLLADVELFGLRPGPAHLVNALLHLAAAWCAFLVMADASGRRGASAALAALWAAHPLQVESVAWVTERSMLLAGLFLWTTLLAYLRHVRRPTPARYLLVVAAAAAGFLAKPIAASLPALLLVLDWWPLGRTRVRPGAPTARLLLLEKAPFAVLAAAFGIQAVLSQAAAGTMAALEVLPASRRAATAVLGANWYFFKAAWPSGLSVYYPLSDAAAPWERVAGAAALLAAISVAAVAVRRRRPQALAGWLWFAVTILPVSGVLQAGAQATADRYAYLPLAGLLVASSSLLPAGSLRARGVLVAGMMLSLVVASWHQAGHWRDEEALFRRAAAQGGRDSHLVHHRLGAALAARGDTAAAAWHQREALRLRPGWERPLRALERLEGPADLRDGP